MESRLHVAMLLSLIGLSAGEHSERREDGLRLEFDLSTEIVNNMAGFPGSDASAGCSTDSAFGISSARCGIGILSEPYDAVKYPDAPGSWPEGSSITGPFIWADGAYSGNEYYIDLNSCDCIDFDSPPEKKVVRYENVGEFYKDGAVFLPFGLTEADNVTLDLVISNITEYRPWNSAQNGRNRPVDPDNWQPGQPLGAFGALNLAGNTSSIFQFDFVFKVPCSSPNANATICADPDATTIFEASRNGNTTSSYDIVLENEASLANEKPEFDTCFFDFDTGVDGVLAEKITAFDVADYFTHSDRGSAADTEEDTRNLPFEVCPNIDTSGAIEFEYFNGITYRDQGIAATDGFAGPGIITEEDIGLTQLLDKAAAQPLSGSDKLTVKATALLVGNGNDNPQVLDDVLLNPELCYLYDICPSIATPVGWPVTVSGVANTATCTLAIPGQSPAEGLLSTNNACNQVPNPDQANHPDETIRYHRNKFRETVNSAWVAGVSNNGNPFEYISCTPGEKYNASGIYNTSSGTSDRLDPDAATNNDGTTPESELWYMPFRWTMPKFACFQYKNTSNFYLMYTVGPGVNGYDSGRNFLFATFTRRVLYHPPPPSPPPSPSPLPAAAPGSTFTLPPPPSPPSPLLPLPSPPPPCA
mmetsp:Transcript_929/g.3140  ORF Transcript_929/g.3140 Transcript_929/m.3140 type:complete len:644 (-) Transcript_929:1084-3015(-)